MYKRLFGWVILANILLVALVPTILAEPLADDCLPWDDDWSFTKKIIIPIDTSNEHAKYQPVDIFIEFDKPCWAVNEYEHSVRVFYWDGSLCNELESQIYDLNYLDDDHINSCNIVFLIPKEANGGEGYYLRYDEYSKPRTNYPNRVDIVESYYRYEQIPGLPFESSFYGIKEGDSIIYGVNKIGTALGTTLTQQVVKLKAGTKNVEPSSGEIGASFDFTYWWKTDKEGSWPSISTIEKLIKHQKIIDGNLMVKFGIESESADGLLKSNVIYKYYYCPTEDKRIYAHVKHEVIGYPLPIGKETEANFVSITTGKVKSNNFEDLNFGHIPPYLHLYSEEERVVEFDLDQHPEGSQIKIAKEDDYDLGSYPWVSFDEGASGKAHAVIFETNNIIKSGDDERDGIQLQLWETNKIQFPGLDNRIAILWFMRNDFEEGEHDIELPENYVLEFDAEFFTTENGGYPTVEEEAKMYQKLIQYHPVLEHNITDDEEETERFNLTVHARLAPSFPGGWFLSTFLGKDFSFVSAEIYKENSDYPTTEGIVSCMKLSDDIPDDFLDLPLIEKIKVVIKSTNWGDVLFVKYLHIPNLEKGRYLIKIFLENALFGEKKQFIGYSIVDLDEDKDVHIFRKSEGKIQFTFLDQDNTGIENVQVLLKKDDFIIAESESDCNGNALIRAPCGIKEKYTLNITYDGFLITEEEIKLGLIRYFIPLKKNFNFDVYDLNIEFKDSDGNTPDFDVDFSLTSKEMITPVSLTPDVVSDGTYKFNNLYPADYSITIRYNSFEIKEDVQIPDIESMSINLYDLKALITDNWNLSPGAPLDVFLTSKDFERNRILSGEKISTEEYHFTDLYPGEYTLKVRYKSYVNKEDIRIPDDKEIAIMFPAVFNVTATVLDSHGVPLKDARFVMIREGKEIEGTTDEEGMVILSVPPGSYVNKIFYNENLIAERKIEVLNGINYKIVTTNEPLHPYIIIGLIIVAFAAFAAISFKRKDRLFLLKLLAVSIALIAIFTPWWELHGNSEEPHLETSTKLFLMPAKIVTITSNSDILAGELTPLEDNFGKEIDFLFITVVVKFQTIMDILPIMIIVGFLFVVLSKILEKYFKRSLPYAVFLSSIIFYTGAIVMFFIAMSEMAKAAIGSFIGNGNLDINIPGEATYETLSCSWGPSIGFYLILCCNIILISIFCLSIRKKVFKLFKLRR